MKKTIKRFTLSLFLVVSLFMPVTTPVHAGESNNTSKFVDATIIFADLHTNHETYKENHINNVMNSLRNTGFPFSSVTSGGDAFSVCEDNSNFPYHIGNTAVLDNLINTGLGLEGSNTIPVNYVWSDHDRYSDKFYSENMSSQDRYNNMTSRFVYGAGADGVYGTDDDANYYVYALSMADTSDSLRYGLTSRSAQEVNGVIADFLSVAETLDTTKPLFIVAHQPLFYNRKDNGHAGLWYEAIYKIADTMDVAYFYGHNHNHDTGGEYYFEDGSYMEIATYNQSSYGKKPLNFSHICAGYMEPLSTGTQKAETRVGTALAIVIYEDSIQYTTYDDKGEYKGNYSLNVTVKRKNILSVERLSLEENRTYYQAVGKVLNNFTGYAIQIPSNAKNNSVSISLPRPLPGSNVPLAVYRVSDDAQTLTRIKTSLNDDGSILSFTTDSNGIYFIGTDLIPDAAPGTSFAAGAAHPQGENVYYVPATSFENGCNYLLVGETSIDGEKIAYLNNNGNEGYETVTISESKILCDNTYAVWTASGNDSTGYTLSNNGRYIGGEYGNTVKGSVNEAAYLMYTHSDVRLHTKSEPTMYLYYSTSGSEQWKFISSKTSSTSSRQMWIYKEVKETAPVAEYCEHAYASMTTEGNCSSVGYTTSTCVLCGHSDFGNFTPMQDTNHEYTVTLDDATNTTTYSCNRCEHSYSITKSTENKLDSNVTTSAAPTNQSAPPVTYEEKVVYIPVDNFEDNGKYLLIGEESIGGAPLAHLNNNGNEGAEKVIINTSPLVTDTTTYKDGYIELNNSNAVWIAIGDSTTGYVLSNNGKYIGTKSDNAGDTIRSSSSKAAKVTYDPSADRLKTASGTTRYLYYTTYSGEYWKWATSANSSSSSRNMWIYKEITVKVPKK